MNEIIANTLLKFKKKNFKNPYLDLKILLREASSKKNDIILSNLNIKDIDIKYFNLLIEKRLKRIPISKIIKKKNFWKSEFFVNYDVLDPRPESELIIEEVLNNIKDKNKKFKILDIGTGSGCLAISIAKELKNSKITAIDISGKAIMVAKKNIETYNLNNQIRLLNSDIDKIKDKYDFIISNPPYIKEYDYERLKLEIKKYEPKIALVGGEDGLKFYKLFAKIIGKIMKKNSFFICEIGYGQAEQCKRIFNNSNLSLIKITKDLQKIDRTLTFSKI
ncbi:peptide chain release factor N(5)-glutamine methyltransferase [Pelagibacteraceae bacterium]|nr:peptide chain release factor N(5)-glutamine methyltransferase [Pelagibacteraceae bacterium]